MEDKIQNTTCPDTFTPFIHNSADYHWNFSPAFFSTSNLEEFMVPSTHLTRGGGGGGGGGSYIGVDKVNYDLIFTKDSILGFLYWYTYYLSELPRFL